MGRGVVSILHSDSMCQSRFGLMLLYFIQGDSGGPLVCPTGNGSWVQAGVASFASADNPEEYPGVFVRVGAYLDWINQYIA